MKRSTLNRRQVSTRGSPHLAAETGSAHSKIISERQNFRLKDDRSVTQTDRIEIIDRGIETYGQTFSDMKQFTQTRLDQHTKKDAIWFVTHPPVYTQGLSGKAHHLCQNPLNIPVIQSDRGGQMTYHGPGQIVCYLLLDLKHYGIGIRTFVRKIENSIIELLKKYSIISMARIEAPGVYVGDKKIASIGLRLRKNFSYHGLALNVAMDLSPFDFIHPCGYSGLKMTQMKAHTRQTISMNLIKIQLLSTLKEELNHPEIPL